MYVVEVWCWYIVGLDASRYHHKVQAEDEDDETEARLLSEEEKYKLCTRLDITCQYKGCGRKNIIDCPLRPCQVCLLIPLPPPSMILTMCAETCDTRLTLLEQDVRLTVDLFALILPWSLGYCFAIIRANFQTQKSNSIYFYFDTFEKENEIILK